ncbi:MAG: hypothetical protein WC788_00165 [Candidatus Paceibacterota bacterium]
MITPDFIMDALGAMFFLGAAYFGLCLIFRKSIWNYPPIASMYIAIVIYSVFSGIVLILQIAISNTAIILFCIVTFVWGYITSRLPARKVEKEIIIETNKGT